MDLAAVQLILLTQGEHLLEDQTVLANQVDFPNCSLISFIYAGLNEPLKIWLPLDSF